MQNGRTFERSTRDTFKHLDTSAAIPFLEDVGVIKPELIK